MVELEASWKHCSELVVVAVDVIKGHFHLALDLEEMMGEVEELSNWHVALKKV